LRRGLTMREVEQPKVYLLSRPSINTKAMLDYLREIGGEAWYERVGVKLALSEIPAAEGLIEFMGRLCYKSWEPGLNKNVTKIREDRSDYMLNLLRSAHGSVLTHAWFSFVIHDGSRVFTAEMNRHGVGTAISEQSLRYVRLDDIPMWFPHNTLSEESIRIMRTTVNEIEGAISAIYELEGIESAEDFHNKKQITSAVRRIAPLGMATEEGWSANVRALRHVIEMRTAEGAEEEIRLIANQIACIMRDECPALFGDYTVTENDAWLTEHRKV
jgi:thymidylate synthase (FAD)